MTVMPLWKRKRREQRHDKAESEQLRQDMLVKHAELDQFVASLRMEMDRPGGISGDRPIAGQ